MAVKAMRFIALLFTALALAPTLAHLLELPNKLGLPKADYLTVQQIYRGWALLGVVVLGALLSTLILAILVRHHRQAFGFALAAFLCLVGTQVVFWTFTYPANAATENWTTLPANWEQLRIQWEYSHAASALLNALAFVAVALCVLTDESRERRGSPL